MIDGQKGSHSPDCAYTDMMLSQIGVVKSKVDALAREGFTNKPFKPTEDQKEPPF
jgi:hypothetical protein